MGRVFSGARWFGIVIAVAGCTSRGGGTEAGAPPSPAAPRRISSLPDNPCDLVSRGEVSVATGLRVKEPRRVPDIEEIIKAQTEGRAPNTSMICSYDTVSDVGTINILLPPDTERSSAAYHAARDAYFRQYPGSARRVPGIGEDAWLAAGTVLHVLAGENVHFTVATRMARPESPEVIAAVARMAVKRLYGEK